MGKLVLCRGSYAEVPYYMEVGDINVYSIEEVNYYIVDKLDLIIELELKEALIDWIKDQLHLEELAKELDRLKQRNTSHKAIIEAILNACNYYSDDKKQAILETIKELESLPIIQRKIKKGNNFLEAKNYKAAENCYESLMEVEIGPDSLGKQEARLTGKEYAQVLHNLGIAKIYTVGIKQASTFFKQAYERNREEESLKQYLFSLKLSNQEEMLKAEIDRYELDSGFVDGLKEELSEYIKNYENSGEYNRVLELKELRDLDRQLFCDKVEDITSKLKRQYRRSVV